jgi:hypothetical protein
MTAVQSSSPLKDFAARCADIDIIKYDPRELAKPPYRLKVHSISPVFAKQVRRGWP